MSPPKKRAAKGRLPVVGWREWLTLPDLGVEAVKAKIDTGARSSSIHATRVRLFEVNGESRVRFEIHPIQRRTRPTVAVEVPVFEFRAVRSSSGEVARRPVIVTMVELLGQSWQIEITLADRDQMGFRMLLGREAVRRRFLVDSGRSFYGGKPSV